MIGRIPSRDEIREAVDEAAECSLRDVELDRIADAVLALLASYDKHVDATGADAQAGHNDDQMPPVLVDTPDDAPSYQDSYKWGGVVHYEWDGVIHPVPKNVRQHTAAIRPKNDDPPSDGSLPPNDDLAELLDDNLVDWPRSAHLADVLRAHGYGNVAKALRDYADDLDQPDYEGDQDWHENPVDCIVVELRMKADDLDARAHGFVREVPSLTDSEQSEASPHIYSKRPTLFADVARISNRLDSDLGHHGAVFLDHLRVSKLAEETGEAYGALLGYQGVNPRKGSYASLDEVVTELADVVVTALGALHHFIGDDTASAVGARAAFVADRLCGTRALGVEVTDG